MKNSLTQEGKAIIKISVYNPIKKGSYPIVINFRPFSL